ncbi:PQQ-dependent sugar dehydrogenase [Algiphilus sp.]|uniref:PQQ-dependent sugar dehydrogenase n=1 Tax=Algiphilus sp. TaxID=1872431 RepID=UPI003B523D49
MPYPLKRGFTLLAVLWTTACNGDPAPDGNSAQGPSEATPEVELITEPLARGLDHPWSLAELPNGDLLVTERSGQLRWLRDGQLQETAIAGVPTVFARNQGGLFDVRLHPDFARNRLVYLSYAEPCPGGATTSIARGRLETTDTGGYRLDGMAPIFRADACRDGGRHFGGRMVFGDDGLLYLSVGDRGHRDEVQDPHNHLGSVLRLTDAGEPAPGNPFADGKSGAPAVLTFGHRNPQGMARHPVSGAIWTHEHGPRGGDEVNRLASADNYGWPKVTHGKEYSGGTIGPSSAPGLVDPLTVWVPSIAPSGLHFVDSSEFSEWKGDLLVGALAGQHVVRLRWHPQRQQLEPMERLLEGEVGRIRDVGGLSDGSLYVLTDARDGALIRLRRALN